MPRTGSLRINGVLKAMRAHRADLRRVLERYGQPSNGSGRFLKVDPQKNRPADLPLANHNLVLFRNGKATP